jgi:uncharacterized protein YqeY
MSLIEELKAAMIDAMRAKEKLRLGTIRMAVAAIRQREIDERITLSEPEVLAVLIKMVKQRKDAAEQFQQAQRHDLADIELAEIVILQSFLPQPLTASELDALLVQAMTETGASNMQDMGKVMGWLKPKVQGRTDIGQLSGIIKAKLSV